jgi:kumamolisin
MSHSPLIGSERGALPGARSTGPSDPDERLEVSVLVRRRAADALKAHVAGIAQRAGAKPGAAMSRDAFERQYGADPADLDAVQAFASAHGLAVVQRDAGRRTVVLSGTVAQFNAAFAVDLQAFEHPGGAYRGRVGAVQLPDTLQGVVEAVLGLDDRPQAGPHFRARQPAGNVRWAKGGLFGAAAAGDGVDGAAAAAAAPTSYTPLQLASLYGFPEGTGSGQCIAIIELGGGYRTADLKQYFAQLGITAPKVSAVSVDHAKNHATGDPNGPDGEVMLDIEVAGAVAPGAHLAVYFAPNTDAGFLDALTTALHDKRNHPNVISISWGGPESTWTAQAMTAFDQAFQAAAAMGVTVCVASGDNGSGDGVSDGADHVDFPASSPHALACGGTSLRASAQAITSETVWNDGPGAGAGGGGVSTVFGLPAWQAGLTVYKGAGSKAAGSPLTKRGVPDVAGVADPQTGYDVRVDGQDAVFGGTSAVAPLWAGLIARLNAAKGQPLGLIQPQLYANAASLNDVTQGNNGDFTAAAGWDACTGLGSPNGHKLATLL